MEIYVIDSKTLNRVDIVDEYQEFVWETPYNDVGSFELRCGIRYFNVLQTERMIQCNEDLNHIGIIERVVKLTNSDGSESIKVSGRMAESIFDRRICFGEYSYESQQPAEIIADLICKNAIDERPIENLEIGMLTDAPEGVIDYAGKNSSLLDEIRDICSVSLLGFRLRADTEEKKLIFDIYYGENRTEKDNTETEIQENEAANLLINGSFLDGFNGWEQVNNERAFNFRDQEEFGPYPMIVSFGTVSKSKVMSIGEEEDEDGNSVLYDIWEPSPHLEQIVNLDKTHIYYMTATVQNPLRAVLSFGVNKLLSFGQKNGYERKSTLFVPKNNGQHTFFAGWGELEEKPDQFAYFRDCIMIDLTSTFGVGLEPSLDWCDNNIYLDSSGNLKYKTQVISFIENANMPLIFSRDRDTLVSVEYEKNTVNERNYAKVKGEGDVLLELTTAEETGLSLKEMFIDLSSISRTRDEIEIPLPSYESMLKKNAMATLKKMEVSEVIDGELYRLSNKRYNVDFGLGDVVSFVDDRMFFSTDLRLSSVEQSWSAKGYKISVIMGTNVPNIIETIKLVSKGAKN